MRASGRRTRGSPPSRWCRSRPAPRSTTICSSDAHRLGHAQELDVVGVEEVGDGEEELRAGPVEDVRGLGTLEPRVERHDHAPGRVDAERGVHPLGGVRRPDRDAVAGLHAARDQRTRQVTAASASSGKVIRSRSSTSASSDAYSRGAARRPDGRECSRGGRGLLRHLLVRYSREGSVVMAGASRMRR